MPEDAPAVTLRVAWDTDPLVRPADLDYSVLADEGVGIRTLSTRRGARVRTGEIVPGTMSAGLDYEGRVLEPGFTGSPWYPNVDLLKRVQALIEPDGEAETVAWTGFIEKLPIEWSKTLGSTALTAIGLLGFIANTPLAPSVLDATIREFAPVSYFPMVETAGRIADDVVGVNDGEYRFPVKNATTLVGFDGRQAVDFFNRANDDSQAQVMIAPMSLGSSPTELSVAWVWRSRGDWTTDVYYPWQLYRDGAPAFVDTARVFIDESGGAFAPTLSMYDTAGTNRLVTFDQTPTIADGNTHVFVVTVNATSGAVSMHVDGVALSVDSDSGSINEAQMLAAIDHLLVGQELEPGLLGVTQENVIGHLAVYDTVVDATASEAISDAVFAPWDGDSTGERLERILDLVGVDPADRDIDTGTQTCGPSFLGGTVGAYIRSISATEGGAIFETADGRIALRERTPNHVTPTLTLSDDPVGDSGVPFLPVKVDYSTDRLLNHAEMKRPGGDVQISENLASRTKYGVKPISLDTLHQTPAGARVQGELLVLRNQTPRRAIDGATVSSRHLDEVPVAVSLDSEIQDVLHLIARPDDDPSSGEPIDCQSIVESIAHQLDGEGNWTTSFGIFEHIELPCFALGDPDAGLDDAVICA